MTADTAQHTETPWFTKGPSRRVELRNDVGDFAIYVKHDGTQHIIAEAFCVTGENSFEPAETNALFIVRACNSHEGLLEACEAMVKIIGNARHSHVMKLSDHSPQEFEEMFNQWVFTIARAKEREQR